MIPRWGRTTEQNGEETADLTVNWTGISLVCRYKYTASDTYSCLFVCSRYCSSLSCCVLTRSSVVDNVSRSHHRTATEISLWEQVVEEVRAGTCGELYITCWEKVVLELPCNLGTPNCRSPPLSTCCTCVYVRTGGNLQPTYAGCKICSVYTDR